MRRLAIYAHFDAQNEVKSFVLHALEKLREQVSDIVFVSTSALPVREQDKVLKHASTVLLKENVGLDFGMWKHALSRIDPSSLDELVLTNSSVFGPLGDGLARAFATMDRVDCDFWGMTDNPEIAWHVMSYFLVFKRPVLAGPALRTFFDHVLPMRNKGQVIRSYEVGLTSWLVENGHPGAVVAPVACLSPLPLSWRVRGRPRGNPTMYHPIELLELGCPFVKVELLRDNPTGLDLGLVRRAMAERGYDLALVEFDRRS